MAASRLPAGALGYLRGPPPRPSGSPALKGVPASRGPLPTRPPLPTSGTASPARPQSTPPARPRPSTPAVDAEDGGGREAVLRPLAVRRVAPLRPPVGRPLRALDHPLLPLGSTGWGPDRGGAEGVHGRGRVHPRRRRDPVAGSVRRGPQHLRPGRRVPGAPGRADPAPGVRLWLGDHEHPARQCMRAPRKNKLLSAAKIAPLHSTV